MSEVPQTDVSRPSALPTAKLFRRGTASQSTVDQNSAEFLDAVEEEWNKKVDMEVETLVDGMVDLVSLATVSRQVSTLQPSLMYPKIEDKDKFRIAQESFQAQSRAESMVSSSIFLPITPLLTVFRRSARRIRYFPSPIP